MRTNILLVDDHPGILKSLSFYLGDYYDLTTARNAAEMRAELKKRQFGAVVLDLDLKGPVSGYDLIKEALNQQAKVIIHTGTCDLWGFKVCLGLGVDGYLDKQSDPSEIVPMVTAVLAGDARFPRAMLAACGSSDAYPPLKLTNRQARVLNILYRDPMPDTPAIAKELKLSLGRVSNILTELYVLFGVSDEQRGDRYALLHEAKKRGYNPFAPLPKKDPRQSDAK